MRISQPGLLTLSPNPATSIQPLRTNERLETSAPQVWAIDESAGSPQFTHVSYDDFRIIKDNLAGATRSTPLVACCMFTDPPLARVGLTEGEARRQGVSVRVASLPTSAVLRTETSDERQGFMKALVAASDDRIQTFTRSKLHAAGRGEIGGALAREERRGMTTCRSKSCRHSGTRAVRAARLGATLRSNKDPHRPPDDGGAGISVARGQGQ